MMKMYILIMLAITGSISLMFDPLYTPGPSFNKRRDCLNPNGFSRQPTRTIVSNKTGNESPGGAMPFLPFPPKPLSQHILLISYSYCQSPEDTSHNCHADANSQPFQLR